MKPAPLGTILPTTAGLARADAHADRVAAADAATLAAELSARAVPRQVGGEIRWYLTPTRYATRTRGVTRWFETRHDGDYAIPSPL